MATPPVSPSLLEGAEPAGFGAGGLVRQCAGLRSALDLAFSAAEMRDAHDLVEGNAWVRPALRTQHQPSAEDTWYLDPTTRRVATWPTDPDTALAVPATAGRIAFAAHQVQRTIAFWTGRNHAAEDGFVAMLEVDVVAVAARYQRDHHLLVRLLVAHITGRPPVDEPTAEEQERRAALTQELAAERAAEEAADAAAEAARRRRATVVWVRLVSPQRGYIDVVGTIADMERRQWEEANPDDDIPAPAIDPAAEGLRTADQLPAGITNAQLLRLVQIREELEMEYDSHYTDESAIRRLKREETQILRAITVAFRAHRARYAPLAAHAAAVVDGSVRRARIHSRRRAALVAWGLVN